LRRLLVIGLIAPLSARAQDASSEACARSWETYFDTQREAAWLQRSGDGPVATTSRPPPTVVAVCRVVAREDSVLREWHGVSRQDGHGGRAVLASCGRVDVVESLGRGRDRCRRFVAGRLCHSVDDPAGVAIHAGSSEVVACPVDDVAEGPATPAPRDRRPTHQDG